MYNNLKQDLNEAEKFLKKIAKNSKVTFQIFPERKGSKVKPYQATKTWDSIKNQLVKSNDNGAGIFFMVNEGDGLGRKTENVKKVRALFLDLDGEPLETVTLSNFFKPDIIVETSEKRYHCYWLCNDCDLKSFSSTQKKLAEKFNGDPSVHDLPRVMRIPGFFHNKKEQPFLSKILKGIND